MNGEAGADTLEGNAGSDTLNGGNDTDVAIYANAAGGVTANLDTNSTSVDGDGSSDFQSGIDNLIGSPQSDSLAGRNGQPNTITGGGGDDNLQARIEGDTLDGQGGTDTVSFQFAPAAVVVDLGTGANSGGAGTPDTIANFENLFGANIHNDTLTGNGGPNQLVGMSGNDTLRGAGGTDALIGTQRHRRRHLLGGGGARDREPEHWQREQRRRRFN